MAFQLTRFKSLLLGLLTATALTAQVDLKLATPTDLLDVYKSGGVKPEMLTVFDFSGSMEAIFWHEKYWTNVNYNSHQTSKTGDSTASMYIDLATGIVYYENQITGNWRGMNNGRLVDASGNLVTTTPITTAVIKQATHVRMTASKTISGTLYTRTVDLPIPWTLFIPGTNTPDFIPDPAAGLDCQFDTLHNTPANVLATSGTVNNPAGTSRIRRIGLFDYNFDYVDWIFFGTDTKGTSQSDNTGPTGTFKDNAGLAPAGKGFVIPGSSASAGNTKAFANDLPAGTRYQFLKAAVLKTWFANQDKLWWGYRFLDTSSENAKSTIATANFTTRDSRSKERDLILFKKSSAGTIHPSVSYIQSKAPANATPLTYALANGYSQMVMNDSGSSVFDFAGTGENPSPCRASYVILFTDGNANDSLSSSGSTDETALGYAGGAWTTETQIKADFASFTKLNPVYNDKTTNFNIWSLAAAAAHANAAAGQATSGSGTPSTFAPFRVKSRGSSGTEGRKITTMTVGLCLAGTNLDTDGGKGPLLKAALFGDPKTSTYNVALATAFGVSPPTGGVQAQFFDATDPTYLANSLGTIIKRVTQADTSITAPAAPLVGLNLGTRAYLGRFASSNDGQGSIWKGDLLMAGIGMQPDKTLGLIDKSGAFQSDINEGNAVASASTMLKAKGWKNRNVFTMVPGTVIPGGGLDLTASAQAFSDQNNLLTNKVMGVSTAAERNSLIRFIRGADRTAQDDASNPTAISTSRVDLMGDVINSSPAAVEYDPSLIPSGSGLAAKWATYAAMKDPRFQVVFVGDNQGHFHAFGEVSGIDAGVLKADLDELWSFVPSELLNDPSAATTVPKLSRLKADGNDHIYTVDGSPYIYFKDTPLMGSSTGNRRVDSGDTVRVIIGMRKGGRSYYALDVVNPGAPKLVWTLDPNTSSDLTIRTMGLATSTPSLARVETGSPAVVKDVLLLGGGYSNNELDKVIIGNNTAAAKLGRSVLALNVMDGTPVKIYDFVNNGALAAGFPNMGAISAGVFPFEFYVGSRKAQRVYFGDQSGGVYALGSMQTLTTAPVGWRLDSSNIDQWTTDGSLNVSTTPGNAGVRWIYKGQIALASGDVKWAAPISAPPVAYRIPKSIPQFQRPASSTNAPNMTPPAVGVVFGTGDRNDPMDLDPIGPVADAPYRQIMVLDRQDSADLPTAGGLPSDVNGFGSAITDAQLSNQTSTVAPGDTSYLGSNQKLGYYLSFHNSTVDPFGTRLFEKSYLSPLVINGALVFSAFKPGKTGSTVICEGAGTTYTWVMCDALAPVFGNGDLAATSGDIDKKSAGCSGYRFTWTNLASDFTAVGTSMVLQSGQDTPPTNASVKIQDLVVPSSTLAFAPRAWRIIR